MLKIKEALVVEGTYDKIKLGSIVDTLIITTDGFRIFSDKEKTQFIRKVAEKSGIIILTDSDSAGFIIRNYVKQGIKQECIKHAYIPDIYGKEKRKAIASKEGKLGVEGVEKQIIISALIAAGATVDGEEKDEKTQGRLITKLDLYNDGFVGASESAKKRRLLLKELNLPERMTSNMLIGAINSLMSYEEYKKAAKKIFDACNK